MGLIEAIKKAAEDIHTRNFEDTGRKTFYCGGSGFADDICVEFFKDTGVIVVTRDGKRWLRGKIMED